MKLKSDIFPGVQYLEIFSKIIAFVFGFALLIAASIELSKVFIGLISLDIFQAIQDGLFILILLEMFYVIRSFLKYGSINVGLVINIGLVAAVKELIFVLESLNLQVGVAFSMIFISMAVVYFIESRYYFNKINTKPLKSDLEKKQKYSSVI